MDDLRAAIEQRVRDQFDARLDRERVGYVQRLENASRALREALERKESEEDIIALVEDVTYKYDMVMTNFPDQRPPIRKW